MHSFGGWGDFLCFTGIDDCMNREEFIILADRVAGGTATEAELRRYNGYYNEYQARQNSWDEVSPVQKQQMLVAAKQGIDAQIGEYNNEDLKDVRKQVRLWPRFAGIAAAVAVVVFGVWLYRFEFASQTRDDGPGPNGELVNDVAPGGYGATITLANGHVIHLDSAKKGVVVGGAAGAVALRYEDGAEIASEAAPSRNDDRLNSSSRGNEGSLGDANSRDVSSRRHDGTRDDVVKFIATTAKGQTYSFTLPDGTRVWLNADSRLEFPNQFSGKERKILLQGEAYFAVKHNDQQPFRVVSKTPDGKGQLVEDIGTEFNINAYADERSVKTTLVEGSARVIPITQARHSDDRRNLLNGMDKGSLAALEMTGKNNDGKGVTLSPNQQGTLQDGRIKVNKVDVEREIAWKKGDFIFNNERLGDIMIALSRWYNIEVSYADDSLKDIRLGGFVSRSKNISAVLKMMKLTKRVDFQIKDRKIIVIPYKPIN